MSIEFQELRKLVDLELIWPPAVEYQQFIVYLNRMGLVPGSIQSKMLALAFYAKSMGMQIILLAVGSGK